MKKETLWVPITPGGTTCDWLAASTEDGAWRNLMREAAHMPYKTKANFQKRGYTVEKFTEVDGQEG